MNQSPHILEPPRREDPRQITHWTRVYAQNRMLGMVASLVLFFILSAAIGGPSYLAGKAYLEGNMPLLAVCIGVLVIALVALIYFSIPWWGGKRLEQMVKRLYAKEGQVQVATPQTPGRRRLAFLSGLTFGTCIVASVALGLLGYIPDKYMQPVSALYTVPFLLVLGYLIRPAVGPLILLWPGLYALHAILIVAGAPILFAGQWESLNMLIPVAGYGLLTGFAGHLYSRFALNKVKRLAQMDLSPGHGHKGAPNHD